MSPAAAREAILAGDQLRTLQHVGRETDADVRAVADAQRALDTARAELVRATAAALVVTQ